MLKEHESMGLMRIRSDSDYDMMTEDEISYRLKQLGEDEAEEIASNRKDKLKEIGQKRQLMVCSDNATLLIMATLYLQSMLHMMRPLTTPTKK